MTELQTSEDGIVLAQEPPGTDEARGRAEAQADAMARDVAAEATRAPTPTATALDLPNILVCGPSGTGKSYCIEHLGRQSTVLINAERKRPPFRAPFPMQSKPSSWPMFVDHVRRAMASPARVVVIDSFTAAVDLLYAHVIRAAGEKESRAAWGLYKDELSDLFSLIRDESKVVVMIAIEELILDNEMRPIKAVAVQGSWKGRVESQFEIALWTRFAPEHGYQFVTNSDGKAPAKSPADMLEKTMPNDIASVIAEMMNYYGYADAQAA